MTQSPELSDIPALEAGPKELDRGPDGRILVYMPQRWCDAFMESLERGEEAAIVANRIYDVRPIEPLPCG